MAEHTSRLHVKQTLKVVPKKPLRAGGLQPTADMQPGEYVCCCESVRDEKKGNTRQAIMLFRVLDGQHSGTGLRMWLTIPEIDGLVSQGTRYARQCALALGCELEPGDPLEPEAIFPGKTFLCFVGYRKTLKMGGPATEQNAQHRKDARDFLRIHELLELREGG